MKKTRMLTEGAMLAAVFGVMLLVTLYVPVIRIIVLVFLPLPLILFCAKYSLRSILVFCLVCLFVSAIMGTVMAIPMAVFFVCIGFVMGYAIQRKKSKLFIYIATSLTFLAITIIELFATLKFFHLNIIAENLKIMQQSIEQSKALVNSLGESQAYEDRFTQMADVASQMYSVYLPSLLLLSAFIAVFVLISVNFPIAKRFGVPVPSFQPFREMRLPGNILWYFILAMAANLLMHGDTSSFFAKAVLNLMLIFQILILLQGYAFISFVSHEKKWPKGLLAFAVILSIIFSPLLYLVMIFGIMDLGFDFRRMIQK